MEEAIRKACLGLTAPLPGGGVIPRLGQGTWHMAERRDRREGELSSLRRGIELGVTMIDTAEMYADGGAESLAGEAIRGIPRESLYLVSKVYPHNAGRRNIFKSCENSLRRLGTDHLDLYLLHWRGNVPLAETVDCMEELVSRGTISRWGVSNFDSEDMEELFSVPGGDRCCNNQVLYHLGSRGVEYDLLPWQRSRGIPLTAYCPIAQAGRLKAGIYDHPLMRSLCEKYGATPSQLMLAFLLSDPLVIAIPKAGTVAHAQENAASALIALSESDRKSLSDAFPAPGRKVPLDMR